MTPYYEHNGITIYHADCRDVLPALSGVDLVLTDPPYGKDTDTNYQRFSGGQRTNAALRQGRVWEAVHDDQKEFDPSHLLGFRRVILWGANNFAHRLPAGAWYIWVKKHPTLLGQFMSDAEVAWTNSGHGVFIFPHEWDGFNRATERGEFYHPTQKPIALMRWCIERTSLPIGSLVVDAYMGSGPTLLAAKQSGMKSIGIDIIEANCEIAARRLSQEVLAL